MLTMLCTATVWLNLTAFPWNNHDFKTFHNVQSRCSTDPRYIETPCVKSFTKSYEQGYRVICGFRNFTLEIPVIEV